MNFKSFTLYIRNSKSYELFVYGLNILTTLRMILTNNISIQATIKEVVKWNQAIKLTVNNIRMTITDIELLNKFAPTISSLISISEVFKLTTKISPTITSSLIILGKVKERTKIVFSSVGAITIVFEPIVATFYRLSEYDNELLSTLDAYTLGQLDHSA